MTILFWNFISINCSFIENESSESVGSVSGMGYTFLSINCSFDNNKALSGGAIYLQDSAKAILYHNTLNQNQATLNYGGAISSYRINLLYSYNSIYTANTEDGVITEAGQIRGEVLDGKNLIDNGTTITRETVFGNNEYKDGYIMPLEFAKSAPRLTINNIEIPESISADSIIF